MAQIYIKFSWTSHFSFISWHSDKILNKVYIDYADISFHENYVILQTEAIQRYILII